MSTETNAAPVESSAPVETVVEKVEEVVKEVIQEAKKFATEAVIELTAEDKLIISKLENEFLRAQSEVRRLQDVIKSAQDRFPQVVNTLVEKYAISPLTHVFDNIELAFKKKQ